MTGVNGWFSANHRTPAGIDSGRANVLLMNGRNWMISDSELDPAGVFATSPSGTDIQLTAVASRATSPATATHSGRLAADRNPMRNAIPNTSVVLIMIFRTLPATWPVSTEPREIAIDRSRAIMPVCMSVVTPTAI
jgi:hypothetical protein